MSRAELRKLKRSVNFGNSPRASQDQIVSSRESAVLLLTRSIQLGHRRLALIRLNLAIGLGASVTPDHWNYCEKIVLKNLERELHELFQAAKEKVIYSLTR